MQFEIPKWEMRKFEMPDLRMPDVPKAHKGWRSPAGGIEGESVDSQLAQFFGVKQGVLVRSVLKETPAERTGLRAGDVILRVDETPVVSPRDISTALRSAAAAGKKTVAVNLMRERKELTLSVTLDEERGEQVRSPRASTAARL
jgi:S1-C subfamily serine protease